MGAEVELQMQTAISPAPHSTPQSSVLGGRTQSCLCGHPSPRILSFPFLCLQKMISNRIHDVKQTEQSKHSPFNFSFYVHLMPNT